ncbi:MAG: nicotinate-nicotinamide nucleotide adenylyltransferase, partial [Hyphomicrobiales bacterium]
MTPLVVLGGTFDPVHVAHLVLGECARVQFGAERVVFLPAGDPYRKTGTGGRGAGPGGSAVREVTAAEHRLAMLRLAVAGNERFEADDREVRRGGPTYTIDTLTELHAEGVRDIVLI